MVSFCKPLMCLCMTSFLLALSNLTTAQAQTPIPGFEVVRFIGSVNRSPRSIENLRKSAIERFTSLDTNGDGFDENDINLAHRIAEAKLRSRDIGAWAANDLDADGQVSRRELETILGPQSRRELRGNGILIKPTPEQIRQTLDYLVTKALSDDINGDGILTLSEVIIRSSAENRRDMNQPFSSRELLAFDVNGDARVSYAEFEAVLNSFLNWMDADGSGTFEPREVTTFKRAYEEARRMSQEALAQQQQERLSSSLINACGRLSVPVNATTVTIGAYEGKALSTVRIGEAGNVTSVIDVNILSGDNQLFLLLDSEESIVWRITGQTDRVVGVGVDGENSGVAGIPAPKVQYFGGATCSMDLWKPAYSYGDVGAAVIARVLGQKPDIIYTGYEIGLINLPGGEPESAYKYPGVQPQLTSLAARKIEADMLRFNPGGVVDIDTETIVAKADMVLYPLLPQEAGLAQLAQAGAIEPTGIWLSSPIKGLRMGRDGIEMNSAAGGVFRTGGGDDLILDVGKTYRIVGGSIARSFMGERAYILKEKIGIPIGLGGSHSVTFFLPKDVPPPHGDIAGSEIRALDN